MLCNKNTYMQENSYLQEKNICAKKKIYDRKNIYSRFFGKPDLISLFQLLKPGKRGKLHSLKIDVNKIWPTFGQPKSSPAFFSELSDLIRVIEQKELPSKELCEKLEVFLEGIYILSNNNA